MKIIIFMIDTKIIRTEQSYDVTHTKNKQNIKSGCLSQNKDKLMRIQHTKTMKYKYYKGY